MNFSKTVLDIIDLSVKNYSYERGGIFGSSNGNVIDRLVMDIPENKGHISCSYSPNVNYLNNKIAEWQNEEILFMGIFHTHFAGVKTLSSQDKKYIKKIMSVMPADIKELFFPIYVLPNRELICYKAKKHSDSIVIALDDTNVI